MEAGSWSTGLMMPRYPDLIILPLCLVSCRCLRESGQSRSRRSDQYQAGHTTPGTRHSHQPPDHHVGQTTWHPSPQTDFRFTLPYAYCKVYCLWLYRQNKFLTHPFIQSLSMSGKVTPLLRCHHITDPCNNAISLHKYLSRRSQMVAAKCWDFCWCLGSHVTLSIVLCNAIMSRVESKDSSIRPRFRYPPHNLRGGQLSTSNIVSQSHFAASLPHLLSVEDTR